MASSDSGTSAPAPSTEDGPVTPESGDKMFGGEGSSSEDLEKLKSGMETAKAAFDKAPSDEKAKGAYVDATVKLATATMLAPELPPNQKYREALRLYREALKLDPDNEEAKSSSQTIIDIYESMGRPVPK